MRVYQAEKEAGIDFQNGSSPAFVTAKIKVGDIGRYFDGMSAAELINSTSTVQTIKELLGKEQPDLALVVAILVSTGWNLNDDIFTPEEVWKARSSAIHKPINDNHQAAKILGHIVAARVLDKSGNEISVADNQIPPPEFDIEVAGVLYRAFDELSERIDEIITKANSGEMFVSMECWFPDFGYGLIDSATGETKLIERTESTAFLTKHLRIYGGCGEYQGYKVGRVLKNMIFGAQGFVDTPANPESVIKVAANKVAVPQVFVTAELNKLLEGGVENVDEKQVKELQAKLDEAQSNLENSEKEVAELQKVAEESKAKDYDGQIDELTAKVTEATEAMKVIEISKSELQKQLDEVTQRAEKCEAELEEIRKTEMGRERLVKLSDVKKIDDEKATLAELREMTDETFDVVLKYAGETKSEKDDKDKVSPEEEAGQAEAVLDNAEEKDGPEFSVANDSGELEKDAWQSMAKAMCSNKNETDEGGE